MPPLRRMPPLRWIPPPPPDWAIAELCREVERSIVIAGGVTTANFPQVAKNFRRSLSASSSGRLVISVMLTPEYKLTAYAHDYTSDSLRVKHNKTSGFHPS